MLLSLASLKINKLLINTNTYNTHNLNKIKEFIFTLIANLAIYICVFFICFACKMDVWAIILIPFIVLYILSIGYGLFLTSKKAVVKDKNGVSLK